MKNATDRKLDMENMLKNINIPNIRINAVDGRLFDYKQILTQYGVIFERKLNSCEIACLLSHIISRMVRRRKESRSMWNRRDVLTRMILTSTHLTLITEICHHVYK